MKLLAALLLVLTASATGYAATMDEELIRRGQVAKELRKYLEAGAHDEARAKKLKQLSEYEAETARLSQERQDRIARELIRDRQTERKKARHAAFEKATASSLDADRKAGKSEKDIEAKRQALQASFDAAELEYEARDAKEMEQWVREGSRPPASLRSQPE